METKAFSSCLTSSSCDGALSPPKLFSSESYALEKQRKVRLSSKLLFSKLQQLEQIFPCQQKQQRIPTYFLVKKNQNTQSNKWYKPHFIVFSTLTNRWIKWIFSTKPLGKILFTINHIYHLPHVQLLVKKFSIKSLSSSGPHNKLTFWIAAWQKVAWCCHCHWHCHSVFVFFFILDIKWCNC